MSSFDVLTAVIWSTARNVTAEGVTDGRLVQLECGCAAVCPIRVHVVCAPLPARWSCWAGDQRVHTSSAAVGFKSLAVITSKRRVAQRLVCSHSAVVTHRKGFASRSGLNHSPPPSVFCSCGPKDITHNGSDKVTFNVCLEIKARL